MSSVLYEWDQIILSAWVLRRNRHRPTEFGLQESPPLSDIDFFFGDCFHRIDHLHVRPSFTCFAMWQLRNPWGFEKSSFQKRIE